jgi:hypothetical protein
MQRTLIELLLQLLDHCILQNFANILLKFTKPSQYSLHRQQYAKLVYCYQFVLKSYE